MRILTILILLSITVLSLSRPLNILESGVNAYIFAFPLVEFEATKAFIGTINTFSHSSLLPNSSTRIIVRPNVDTLYSFAFLDLTDQPLYLMMPDTENRYYVLQIMDAWTNVFGSYGKRTTGTKKQEFFFTNSSWEGVVPEGLTHVVSPTKNAWIAGRIQIDGEWDVPNVRLIQQRMVLRKYSDLKIRELSSSYGTNKTSPDAVVNSMSMIEFFGNFTKSMKVNAPAKEDAPMVAELKKLGIEPGNDWNQTSLSSLDKMALSLGYKLGKHFLRSGKKQEPINGWVYKTDTIGKYGTDYKTRAMIAEIGLAANLPEDAVYCNGYFDENGESLSGDFSYVLHMEQSELPPVNQFWSLTMYGEDNYLVPNDANKYAVRDRDPLVFNADGSLDILIQNTNPGDSNFANWLPAPKGKFNVTLRLYWPKESVLDKTWKPNGIKKVQKND